MARIGELDHMKIKSTCSNLATRPKLTDGGRWGGVNECHLKPTEEQTLEYKIPKIAKRKSCNTMQG